MQAPDGQKGHEPQFWAVLRFDEEGNVLPIEWVDEMTLVRVNASGSALVSKRLTAKCLLGHRI